jgi:hypothetical protein
MNHTSHVGFIDTHAEGIRGDEDWCSTAHKTILHLRADPALESCVISLSSNTPPAQVIGECFNTSP